MDFKAHRRSMLTHYVTLSKNPGWRRYVEHQVKLMAAETPELYRDFPARLKLELDRAAAGALSPASATSADSS